MMIEHSQFVFGLSLLCHLTMASRVERSGAKQASWRYILAMLCSKSII